MKKVLILFFLCWSLSLTAQRYLEPVFTAVKVHKDVIYGAGTNVGGSLVNLSMDIYEPEGDTENARPLIVFMHGGSFISGDKKDMAALCMDFASKGYVAATIGYRIGINQLNFFSLDTELVKANFRAVQDHKAAMRFFYRSALSEGNPYRIDLNRIITGGISAGAIAILHAQLFKDVSTAPAFIQSIISGLGGVDGGNNGSPGYKSDARGLFNMMGAILDVNMIGTKEIATASFHGDADNIVPYGEGYLTVSGINIIKGNGSARIHEHLIGLGANSELHTFPGVGHELTADPNYMQTIVSDATRFFYDAFVSSPVSVTIQDVFKPRTLEVGSSGSPSMFTLFNPEQPAPYVVFDAAGKKVKAGILSQGLNQITLADLARGSYTLRTNDAIAYLNIL